MYNPNMGFINEFLKLLGLENFKVAWLSEPKIALYCVYFAALWQGIGQPMICLLYTSFHLSKYPCKDQSHQEY